MSRTEHIKYINDPSSGFGVCNNCKEYLSILKNLGS